ncbi:MAG TPA: hypothetical protein PL149_09875 [Candidatus Kapabacteria bacterium]|jgi:intergrase/recombinase|nr:hypothetical protein [Candidatus Kapabacteria bacterium]HPU24443.1 hypothetical protein [Candidatus Kapabacteria bacterium]
MSPTYEDLKELIEKCKPEWNMPTAYYFLGRLHQAYEKGLISREELNELREMIELSKEEARKVAFY